MSSSPGFRLPPSPEYYFTDYTSDNSPSYSPPYAPSETPIDYSVYSTPDKIVTTATPPTPPPPTTTTIPKKIHYPKVTEISSEINEALTFRLNADMSIANAIRRTILSDIPVVVIDTQKCIIETNQCGGGQHNEYLKHRLDCIPVIVPPGEMLDFVQDYYLSVDVNNESTSIKHVTTEDFKIMPKAEAQKKTYSTSDIFPPYQHKWYIEFAHLKPGVGGGEFIPGGAIKFTADFKVSTAKENAAYNAVYKCTAPYTVDTQAATAEWKNREAKMKEDNKSESEITLSRANFWALDAQRIYVKNSFDFEVRVLGMYRDREIVKHACAILENKFSDAPAKFRAGNKYIIQHALSQAYQVSDDSNDQTFIIHMGDEDYTMGKVIEYILYEYYYFVDEPEIRFCAFKKMHPHDAYGVLQVSLVSIPEMNDSINLERIHQVLEGVCKIGVKLFSHIGEHFGSGYKSN